MLENCYDPATQEMIISDGMGYLYYLEDGNDYMLHQFEKFLHNMGLVAKQGVKQLSINHECPSNGHLWDFIENNQDLSVLTISGEFFEGSFLENDLFYKVAQKAKNLYYIHVFVGEDEFEPDMELVEKKLNAKMPERSFIISWGCATLLKTASFTQIFYDNDVLFNERGRDSLNEEVLLEKLSAKKDFGLPLIFEALEKRLVGKFNGEERDLLTASLDLEKEFDSWRLLDYAVLHDDILSTRFLMRQQPDLSIQNSGGYRPLEIAAEYAGVDVLRALLELNPSARYLPSEKVDLLRLENEMQHIPIMIAASNGKLHNVQFLLQYDIGLSQLYDLQQQTIDLAWKKQHIQIVLYLLKQNFPFPSHFDVSQINNATQEGKELIEFVTNRQFFHDLIKQGNVEQITNIALEGEKIGHGFNLQNTSALNTALSSKQYKSYAYLKTKGFKSPAAEALEETIINLNEHDKNALNKALLNYFSRPNDASVFYLLSRSRTLQREGVYFDTIRFIYEQLINIPGIAPLLSVIEHYKGTIDIIFDFNQVNTMDLDVTSHKSTEGRCRYDEGRIFIAAKLDHQELLGNVAHEITHLAIQILYNNDCKPYAKDTCGDEYKKIIETYSKLNVDSINKIIKLAFTAYHEKDWEAELIVRIPHILARYGREAGMTILQNQVPDLLKYYNEVLIPELHDFIKKYNNLNIEKQVMESRVANNQHSFWGTPIRMADATTNVLANACTIL
ncbi:MAG: hypothetical protein LEGION0403_FIIPPAGN_00899 [Legionella sp.]